MSATFASRLTGSDGRDLRMAIVIQGVPYVFQQGLTSLPDAVVALAGYGDGSGHTRLPIVGKVEQAAKDLDLQQRRMIGGSLTVELQDDDAGTLLGLFSPRKRRVAFVVVNATTPPTDSLLKVSSAAGIVVGSTIYVGGESFVVVGKDTVPNPDEVEVSPGGAAFGSEGQLHFGTTDQGASVFTSPPSWTGRRVKLIGYFEKEDGTTTADLAMVLDTFRLEEAPKFTGEEGWQLQCSHLSDEFAKRKLGTGLRDVQAGDYDDGALTFTIFGGADRFVVGGVPTWVRIRGQSASSIVTVDASIGAVMVTQGRDTAMITELVSVASLVITVRGQNLVEGGIPVLRPTDLRHIAILDGVPAGTAILYALLSRLGAGANHATYDKLPGKTRTGVADNGWSFGAGIRGVEVDTAAFEAIGNEAVQWSFVIDDEFDVEEVLRDFCVATGSFWLVDRDGLLTVKRLSEERLASSLTINDDVIIGEPTVEFVEQDIAPRVRLTCNWDTVSEKFLAVVNMVDSELADRYPDHHERLELESRGLVVGVGPAPGTHTRPSITVGQAEVMLRTLQKQGDRGRILVSCSCHLDAILLDLGDVVTVTVDVPDLEGILITGRTGRVLSVGTKTDEGIVDVTFELFEPLLAIAPAAVITGTSGGLAKVVLEASLDGSATPARMFAAGWFAEQRNSAGVYVDDFTILSIVSDTVVELDHNPVLTAGDFLCSIEQANADNSAAVNTDGLGLRDFTYQMPSSEADVIAGSTSSGIANEVTRWR